MDKRKLKKELLSFLINSEKGIYYHTLVKEDFFIDNDDRVIFGIINGYYNKYKEKPTKSNLISFFIAEIKKNKQLAELIKTETKEYFKTKIKELFLKDYEESNFNEEQIINFIKLDLFDKTITRNLDKFSDPSVDLIDLLYKDLERIKKVENPIANSFDGIFFRRDTDLYKNTFEKGHPTCFKSLNAMTSAKGFKKPELIIFLAGPKCFKTGIMIEIGYGYMEDGLNVYYADFENGKEQIQTRFAQRTLKCTYEEIEDKKYIDEFESIKKQMNALKFGEIVIDKFRGKKDSLMNVDARLTYLKEVENWVPDVIIYDYIDLANASDPTIKDPRLKIQANYHEAISLNVKYNCFSISVSKVKSTAFEKEIITISDFGEDSEKAYNCHASFAICRTEEEIKQGYARIIPLLQRQGISRRPDIICPLKVDEVHHYVEELKDRDYDDYS